MATGGVDGRFHAVNGLHRLVRNRKGIERYTKIFQPVFIVPALPRWPSTP